MKYITNEADDYNNFLFPVRPTIGAFVGSPRTIRPGIFFVRENYVLIRIYIGNGDVFSSDIYSGSSFQKWK